MTRTELKVVLKLHHDWKVNYRRDYARLLMLYSEGKILSLFEAAAAEPISFYHEYNIYNHEICWAEIYSEVVRTMSSLANTYFDLVRNLDTDSFAFKLTKHEE